MSIARSREGYAELSLYQLSPNSIGALESVRTISEKWLFAIVRDVDQIIRQYYHAASLGLKSSAKFEKNLIDKGTAFSKLLFGDIENIDDLFVGESSSPVIFSVDREYGHLPFEMLSDGKNFLSDLRPVLRSLRRVGVLGKQQRNSFRRRKKRIYLPIAAPDKPDVWNSANAERNNLAREVAERKLSLVVQAGEVVQLRLSTLLNNMQTADFMHFAGHSTQFEIPLSDDEKITPDDIAHLHLNNLNLVFLNSCDSAALGVADQGESFASAFLNAGVGNFIGYSMKIPNKASEAIGLSFWRNMGQSAEPHIALFKARAELRRNKDVDLFRLFVQHFGDLELEARKRQWHLWAIAGISALGVIGVPWLLMDRFKKAPAENRDSMFQERIAQGAGKNQEPKEKAVEEAEDDPPIPIKAPVRNSAPAKNLIPVPVPGTAPVSKNVPIQNHSSVHKSTPTPDIASIHKSPQIDSSATVQNSLPIHDSKEREKDPGVSALLKAYIPLSIKFDFTTAEVGIMDRIWLHMEEKVDRSNQVCDANLKNGNKSHGQTPIGRRQIIRNLLVFRCIPEAPADWDAYALKRLKPDMHLAAAGIVFPDDASSEFITACKNFINTENRDYSLEARKGIVRGLLKESISEAEKLQRLSKY